VQETVENKSNEKDKNNNGKKKNSDFENEPLIKTRKRK